MFFLVVDDFSPIVMGETPEECISNFEESTGEELGDIMSQGISATMYRANTQTVGEVVSKPDFRFE